MGKFRLASGGYKDYDDTEDRQKLYDKSLDVIEKQVGNDIGMWVKLRCALDNIFSKEQPSINQLKSDLKKNLLSKEK